jgi:hypothetical protein
MERYGKGQTGEGGGEYTYHCLSLNGEACRFTVPPAVALLNYISSGILWRIFCQTGTFRGVFSIHISLVLPFIYVPLPRVCLICLSAI